MSRHFALSFPSGNQTSIKQIIFSHTLYIYTKVGRAEKGVKVAELYVVRAGLPKGIMILLGGKGGKLCVVPVKAGMCV